ncbi:unnamed protein product [Mytilus edulis]|uniref:Uncharacterized protein n=1 Tax=Mytilus edulis TaxID=6550 RepID=A0A8S3VC69_MYTED|nr:unnamed protein product [Mytilus edulis]
MPSNILRLEFPWLTDTIFFKQKACTQDQIVNLFSNCYHCAVTNLPGNLISEFISKPEHWNNQNGLLQNTNGFSHHGNYQNGFIKNQMHGYNNHINGTIPSEINQLCNGKVNNGFLHFSNLFSQNGSVKNQNGLPHMDAATVNNNSICISTSTEEHYSSITHQQGYDSLLVQSLGNQYDGS